jgi:TIR domain
VSKAKIFISHSAKQKKHRAYLETLVKELQEKGFDPWVDYERLRPGDLWNEQITSALVECHSAVLLCSEQSIQRHFVKYEVSYLSVRKRTEPDFQLCPLLLDGLQPEVMKTGFFGAIRFDDIQFGRWEDPDRKQKLLGLLEPCKQAAAAPMLPTGRLELYLSAMVFSKIPAGLLKAAAKEIGWTQESNWDLPQGHAQLFTRHLLTAPLEEQYAALKQIAVPLEGKFAKIFELVAPCWVNERAAMSFFDVLRAPPGQRGAVVNGTNAGFTPEMYLRRARAHMEPHPGLVPKQKAEEGQLEGTLAVLLAGAHVPKGRLTSTSLKRQVMLSILYQLGELQSADETGLLAALAMKEQAREGIVSVLLLGEHDLAEVAALQEEYKTVTFFVLTGANIPAIVHRLTPRLQVIEPHLGSEGETRHNEEYAHDWYGTIRTWIADEIAKRP